jgi:hypothetical protein
MFLRVVPRALSLYPFIEPVLSEQCIQLLAKGMATAFHQRTGLYPQFPLALLPCAFPLPSHFLLASANGNVQNNHPLVKRQFGLLPHAAMASSHPFTDPMRRVRAGGLPFVCRPLSHCSGAGVIYFGVQGSVAFEEMRLARHRSIRE